MSGSRGGVVVTGIGVAGPGGAGVDRFLTALRDGVTTVARRDTGEGRAGGSGPQSGRARYAALVGDPVDPGQVPAGAWRRLDRASRLAVTAAAEALAMARVSPPESAEVGVVLGTMSAGCAPLRRLVATLFREGPDAVSPLDFPFTVHNAAAGQCAILHGLKGPNLTTCRMEASGLDAILQGARLVADGVCETVLAGGVDEVVEPIVESWDRWRITARGRGRFRGPFDRGRSGFAPGEGVYLLLLESGERARRRGVEALAGVGGAAAVHASGPTYGWPSGPAPVASAMRGALEAAGLTIERIDALFASANGARVLDELEAHAIDEVAGDALRRLPVTSIKGAMGESGAASAGSAVAAVLAIQAGFVPPVAALVDFDPAFRLRPVRAEALRRPVAAALVNGLGTGGSIVSLVLSRPGV